jgi:hypothetical protein
MIRTKPSPRTPRDLRNGTRAHAELPARRDKARGMAGLWAWMRRKERVRAEPARAGIAPTPERAMQQSLTALLDWHPPTRAVLRHLAVVEQSLTFPQLYPLDDLTHEHLTIALKQLDRLVHDWRDASLCTLRDTLRKHLADRVREEFGTFAPVLSDFVPDSGLMVEDATMSSFVSAGEWLDDHARRPHAPAARATTR